MRSQNFKNVLRLTPVFILLVAGVWLLQRSPELSPEGQQAREAIADRLGMEGEVRDNFLAEANEDPEAENKALLEMGDYFITRYTYPTGEFNQQWLLEAAEQDRNIARGIPAGSLNTAAMLGDGPLNLDPTKFTSLGPQPLGSGAGTASGRNNFIVSDPVSPTIAYFGSDGGGVWKTTNCCDANTTWQPMTDDPLINSAPIGHLYLDPNDHNTIYAGTGDLRYGSFSFGAAGLLKSTDGGQNWTILGASIFGGPYPPDGVFPQYQAIGKVVVDPNDSSKVIVGTKTGLYFSYDSGTNWDGPCFTNAFNTQRQDMTGLIVRSDGASTTVFAAVGTRGFPTAVQPDLGNTGANGVYSSTVPASGCPASWNLLNNGWPPGTGDGNPANDLVGRIDLAMAPSNTDVLYAQVADNTNSSGTRGVWRTSDGGASWTQVATPGDFFGCGSGVGQTWYNAGVTVDPNNPDIVFLSMIDLYRSTDGGDTFNDLTNAYCGGLVHPDNHARAFVGGSSDVLLNGNDGGIWLTLNATAANPTFMSLNNSVSTIEFYSGDLSGNFATSTNPAIVGGAQDNNSSVFVWNGVNPGPAPWVIRYGGDGMFARVEPVLEQRFYMERQNGVMAVTTAGPFSPFQSATGGWLGDTLSFIFPYEIYRYSCPGTGCEHLIAGSNRVWETIEGGVPTSSWLINSLDLTKQTLGDRSHINQLAFAVTDETIAIVGTNDGNVQFGFNMGQGVANSATWVDVTGGNAVLPNRPILDVASDPANPLVAYAAVGGFSQNTPGTPGHVYQVTCTANCGSFTWLDKSGNLPNIPVDSIIANPNFPQQVFAGTDWGLYYTDDITAGSPVWYKFTNGLPGVMIWDMTIDYDGSMNATTLALWTRSRGAYVWPLASSAVHVDYNVTIDPNTSIDGLPGTSVVHDYTLYNLGLNDDSYNLSISGESWPTTILTASPIAIQSGMSATVQVQVDIPHAPNTSDSFTITATSVNSPTVSTSAMGTTNAVVNPNVGVSTSNSSQTGNPGDVLTYTVTVANTGDYTDTFTIDLSGNNWPTTASTLSVGPLGAGQSADIEIYVTVGSNGSDTVTVTAISGLDSNVSDSVDLNSMVGAYTIYMPVVLRP